MNKTELQIKIVLYRRELRELENIKVGCHSCMAYSMPKCLNYESNPPPDVVQSGCDEWDYDDIPF